jgi:hypothetical protein
VVQTVEGIAIEWSLPTAESLSRTLRRHLCWIGDVRSRIRSCRNDVDLAAGEIRNLAGDRAWDEAIDTYEQVRAQLDEVLNDVFCTEWVLESRLAPELTEIERTLEKAHTRLSIERAQSQLELGRQLLANGDYDQGRTVLRQTQQYHSRAKQQLEAVQRGDGFQFGTQRTLEGDIQRLGWQLDTVAAEPIRQAREAKTKARAADNLDEAVSRWELVFQRYGYLLTLECESDEPTFAGDRDAIRRETVQAAKRLIDRHSTLADVFWDEGADRQAAGDHETALRCCLDAQQHLERAHELTTVFQLDRATQIAPRLETMADEVMRMRSVHGESTAPAETEVTGADQTESPSTDGETATGRPERGDADERPLPSASELAEIDTHHDITLDAETLQARPAAEMRTESESDDVESEQVPEPGSESSHSG